MLNQFIGLGDNTNYEYKSHDTRWLQAITRSFRDRKSNPANQDFFQENLAEQLNLRRVTAPLFIKKGTGVNDDLNGVEAPVTFKTTGNMDYEVEIGV